LSDGQKKKKYIKMFGSFTEPFNSESISTEVFHCVDAFCNGTGADESVSVTVDVARTGIISIT